MKHYTSYYSNFKNIPKNYYCIGISRYCPEWINPNTHPTSNFFWRFGNCLAPSSDLLDGSKQGNIDITEYKVRYKQQISTYLAKNNITLDEYIFKIDNEVSQLGEYDAIVFLCYESPNDFCHRHILREMINDTGKLYCEELITKSNQEKTKSELNPLF